ncbi:GspE/PulE family protein [Microvirga brassicacearum]|uniref:Type II secretion system protein GspE n=1 Tax=Microvirga brassicacearum TaxID=2580413 RepID=A0A5N3P4M7_9HYPH|nr:ATPase, T2SS/T4P/T4SS family [Microvirga brassicacearum]KAB0264669.1 type II secretion system protein GspE [Microvirga brassicacearum]
MTGEIDQAFPEAEEALVERVLKALTERAALTPQALERGRRAATESGERHDRVLNKLGLVPDAALTDAWSTVTGLRIAAVDEYPTEALLTETLPVAFLAHAQAIPIRVNDATLHLAVVDPLDRFSPAAIKEKTGLDVIRLLARPGDFTTAFARLYHSAAAEPESQDGIDVGSGLYLDVERLRDLASDAPVIRMVHRLIDQAIERKASDLHISGTRTGVRVRYRIDGLLHDAETPPPHLHAAIISRLKIMAGLDIAERRLPQDGRIRVPWRGREIDLRVSTMPHLNGEGAVLRVLDRSNVALDFATVGLSPPIIKSLRQVLSQTHGLLLVTGPTGSGKTTTLYAALESIAAPELNVVTVEDPVEYQLDGINQIQVSKKIGLDFAGALRAVLRQDPDVIMVGEIRDSETAAVANQAALTGHLVLATLHTNNAVAALPRLVDMGIEPYLLASTVRASMAQRLARRLCQACREPHPIDPFFRDIWGERLKSDICFRSAGCSACGGTGHAGRIAIAEFVPMTASFRSHLLRRSDEATLSEDAQAGGFETMLDDGLAKVAAGLIDVHELVRIIGST